MNIRALPIKDKNKQIFLINLQNKLLHEYGYTIYSIRYDSNKKHDLFMKLLRILKGLSKINLIIYDLYNDCEFKTNLIDASYDLNKLCYEYLDILTETQKGGVK